MRTEFNAAFRQYVYERYMKKVDDICEDCDWVTSFDAEDVVNMVLDIVQEILKSE